MTINEYCTKIKSMMDRLKNHGCVVSEKNLVIYAVNKLDSRFATLVEIIRHREPFPTFETMCNVLLLKESSMNDQSGASTTFESNSLSPTILMAINSPDNKDSWLRFAPAFWSDEVHRVLVLRFGALFWLCVLLIEDSVAFCPGKTLPVSKLGCVLCQAAVAFCLEDFLRFTSRPLRFVLRAILAESTEEAPPFGPERPKLYSDLTSEEKDRYNADIRATNILLQGLPKDIYTLINHYIDAKKIWDNVKMLLEGSELTKEDRESQLSDEFEHFRQHKEESIHDYYVRFSKLINDMRNIKMTMSRLQLNSKFVNNMLPEWGRFVMAVKLNRGLRDSNYDQLYAYLKQHETHAKENKMMLKRFSQPTVYPLALLSNVSNPQHYSPSSSASSSTQVPPPLADSSSPAEDLIENLTKQLALGMNPWGGSAAGYEGAHNRVGNVNQGQARPGQPRPVKCYNCNGTRERSSFGRRAVAVSCRWTGQRADDCDAFDSDVDEAPTAQTMFMANLSFAHPVTDEVGPSYDSDVLSEVQDHDQYQDAACAHHEEHVMHDSVQLDHVVDSHADYTTDSNMISYDQYVQDNEVPVVHSDVSSVPNDAFMMIYDNMCEPHDQSVSYPSQNTAVKNSLTAALATYKEQVELFERRAKPKPLYNELNKVAIGYKNPLCLTRAKLVQPALYNGHEIIKDNHTSAIVHNAEDTLEIAEITRKKMIAKMNDPECVTRKVKEYQEKDKIRSKPNKNEKRGEAEKSQKQLQLIKQEKLTKTQKEGPEM
nr:hybrid signal transduction histidine kinase M [Tanacetum cinerariifolium]